MPACAYYFSAHWKALRQQRLRMDQYCCVVPGCCRRAVTVDHIEPRPMGLIHPCELDRIDNLRSLCLTHDCQVRQRSRIHGYGRGNGGRFHVKGCDVNGMPFDPNHQR